MKSEVTKPASIDYLIVGSGLMGATFAHLARQAGKRCMVVERRKHTGGNVHCQTMAGINVHQYGPHILHTSDRDVWRFVKQFALWSGYKRRAPERHAILVTHAIDGDDR